MSRFSDLFRPQQPKKEEQVADIPPKVEEKKEQKIKKTKSLTQKLTKKWF